MQLLFIHRSVGNHLLKQGKLRQLLDERGLSLDDYDNNVGVLTTYGSQVQKDSITMLGNNTNPENLAAFFRDWPELLDGYDAIMMKSCYPNSHIKDEAQLARIKGQYESIFQAFHTHKKPLIVLTTPPLRPLRTTAREAELANQLAAWLVDRTDDTIRVFDFHAALAEPTGCHAGMLKRSYRRVAPWDTHPNKRAHRELAPLVALFIASSFSEQPDNPTVT